MLKGILKKFGYVKADEIISNLTVGARRYGNREVIHRENKTIGNNFAEPELFRGLREGYEEAIKEVQNLLK